jgi:hypothetical protein
MNKRIEELSKEAWRQIDVSKIRGRHSAYTKIFAELMVKECANVVDDKTSTQGYGVADGWAEGSDLLEHFGVES